LDKLESIDGRQNVSAKVLPIVCPGLQSSDLMHYSTDEDRLWGLCIQWIFHPSRVCM
jgi:hypothetical protein